MGRYQADPDDSEKSGPKGIPQADRADPPKWSPGPSYRFVVATESVAYEECRSVYVGTAGDITLTGADGETAAFTAVPAGTVLPTRATKWSGDASDVTFLY